MSKSKDNGKVEESEPRLGLDVLEEDPKVDDPHGIKAQRVAERELNGKLRAIECYCCGARGPYTVTQSRQRKRTEDTFRLIVCRRCGYGTKVSENAKGEFSRLPDEQQDIPPDGWPKGTKRQAEEERKEVARATAEGIKAGLLDPEFASALGKAIVDNLSSKDKKAVSEAAKQ